MRLSRAKDAAGLPRAALAGRLLLCGCVGGDQLGRGERDRYDCHLLAVGMLSSGRRKWEEPFFSRAVDGFVGGWVWVCGWVWELAVELVCSLHGRTASKLLSPSLLSTHCATPSSLTPLALQIESSGLNSTGYKILFWSSVSSRIEAKTGASEAVCRRALSACGPFHTLGWKLTCGKRPPR